MTAIECKLIRKGGTTVDIGGTEYQFVPYTDGAHVCEVENEEHADRFLSITEGYRLYRGDGEPATDEAADAAEVADERMQLVAQYTALYGDAPHPRTGIKKLREMIAAKQ